MTLRDYHRSKTDELTLARVLVALSDPTRPEMIRRLADGQEHGSLELADDLPRPMLTYHACMLREAGVTWTQGEGRACLIRLRCDDLDRPFPGVLAAVVANTSPGAARA